MSNEVDECFEKFEVNISSVSDPSDELRLASLVITVLSSVLLVMSIGFFLLNRKISSYLEKRNLTLLLFFNLGIYIAVQNVSLLNVVGRKNYSCAIFIDLGSIGFYLSFFATLMRALSLFYRIKYSKKVIEHQFENMERGRFLFRPGAAELLVGADPRARTTDRPPVTMNFQLNASQRVSKTCCGLKACFETVVQGLFCYKAPDYVLPSLKWLNFLSSKATAIKMFLAIVIPVTVLTLADNLKAVDCFGCGGVSSINDALILFGAVIIIGIVVLFFFRNIPDSLGVKKEIFLYLFLIVAVVPFTIVIPRLSSAKLREIEEEGLYDVSLHQFIIQIVCNLYTLVYQVFKARRLSKRTGFTLTGEFDTILNHSEKGSQAFALYLSTLLAVENIYFYKVVQKWKKEFEDMSDAEKSNFARFMKASFFDLSSKFVINIEGTMRANMYNRLDNLDLTKDMFEQCENEITTLLYNLFAGFTESQFYSAHNHEFV